MRAELERLAPDLLSVPGLLSVHTVHVLFTGSRRIFEKCAPWLQGLAREGETRLGGFAGFQARRDSLQSSAKSNMALRSRSWRG